VNGEKASVGESDVERSDQPLAEKARRIFGEQTIDKRRLPASQLQKRGVPAYVGEWILDRIAPGLGPLSLEDAEKVQTWAERTIPGPGEQGVLKHRLMQGDTLKVLTPVQAEVRLGRKGSDRFARLTLLGLDDVNIGEAMLDEHPDLLRQGLWGVTELVNTSSGPALSGFRPMQASAPNLTIYRRNRAQFTLDEWRRLLLTSMGYRPGAFCESEQTYLLTRLLPLVQKNMHLMELAPKGTGKSYLYENINPKVRLISGGNVSPAVLFVNNASGQWGLLARFAVVVLDEVQTLKFEKPDEIIGGLKGFLANGRLTRGGLHETASDCSLVLLANIALDDQQRPLRDLLVEELPEFLRETAFLDRMRGIIPGWKTRKLGSDCFADSVGWKSDFFGDTLLTLREDLSADRYAARRIRLLGGHAYRRNEEAVRSIASGMMKLLFPHGEVTDQEFWTYCVAPARELRQLVWDQLYALDAEYRQYDRELECALT
jgi:ATP-dependent Lon protease